VGLRFAGPTLRGLKNAGRGGAFCIRYSVFSIRYSLFAKREASVQRIERLRDYSG